MIQAKGTKISTLPIIHVLNGRKLHKGEDLERVIGEILSEQGFDGCFQVDRATGTVSKFRWSLEIDPLDYLENGEWPMDWQESQNAQDNSYHYHQYETCGYRK